MKSKLLQILICPDCKGDLRLEQFVTTREVNEKQQYVIDIEEGVLICNCGYAYPVIEGVPRLIEGALSSNKDFLSRWNQELYKLGVLTEKALLRPSAEFSNLVEPTLKRFEKEWTEHNIEDRTWGLDQQTRLAHSLRYLGWAEDQIKGKLVLDAGAGTGQLTCSLATLGCDAVGIDLSPAIVRGWRLRGNYANSRMTYVHLVQGNLLKPPFRPGVFDGVMSMGVLHHTPDTKQAFAAIAPVVRKGGALAVWLYRAGIEDGYIPVIPSSRSSWAAVRASRLRWVTTKLPPGMLYSLVVAYATFFHFLYSLNALIRKKAHNQSIKERATSLFDMLAPPFAWKHTPREVTQWFEEMDFSGVRDTSLPNDSNGFCITGRREV